MIIGGVRNYRDVYDFENWQIIMGVVGTDAARQNRPWS